MLLPLSGDIPKYEENNNKCAVDNMDFLRDKVYSWEKQGYLRRVEHKPHCCSPFSVAIKEDLKSGSVKKRPCLDLSRHVNSYLQSWPAKLANLDSSAHLLDPGDWQAALDLENQYFHVRVHPNHQKYLGCKIIDENGAEQYFVFCVMVYGIKVATAVVTRLIKPIVSYLHQEGVKFSIYIDDGRTAASTFELTLKHHELAIDVFQKAGWNIQFAKTSKVPTQHLYYQGFVNDTKNMIYYVPHFKKENLQKGISTVLQKYSFKESISVRDLAKLTGKLVACNRAFGPVIKILLRSIHQAIDEQV